MLLTWTAQRRALVERLRAEAVPVLVLVVKSDSGMKGRAAGNERGTDADQEASGSASELGAVRVSNAAVAEVLAGLDGGAS